MKNVEQDEEGLACSGGHGDVTEADRRIVGAENRAAETLGAAGVVVLENDAREGREPETAP